VLHRVTPVELMGRRPAALAVALAATLLAATATAARPARPGSRPHSAAACRVRGSSLLRTPSVVVWRTMRPTSQGRRDTYYGCAGASGRTRTLVSFLRAPGAYPVNGLSAAGRYVAFYYFSDPTVSDLEVFDLVRGVRVLQDMASCMGHSACPGFPTITRYLLARNGWVAELLSQSLTDGLTLLATDGRQSATIDYGLRFGRLSLTGTTLHWTSDGQSLSAALNSRLIPPATAPTPLPTACGLLTASDVQTLLGPGAPTRGGAAPTTTCSISTAAPLQLTLQTGLTPAQALAAQNALDPSFNEGGPADGFAGSNDEHSSAFHPEYDGQPSVGGVQHRRSLAFLGSIELTVDLARAGTHDDVRVQRLLLEAVTRLHGLPIHRAG
jgi:hypothetical protein